MVLGGEHHVPLAGAASQVNEVVRIEFWWELNRRRNSRYSASEMPSGWES